ncbi:MAG TPA: four helix bundle protein [Planctomycetota bacterium]|nr:four helix bundle protein [Planctomycetota bacterium]
MIAEETVGGESVRDHRKLDAFRLADELALAIYTATREFPQEERYSLAIQMRRAAVSVASNIVEGAARDTQAEYARFLNIAFSSSKELGYQISLAARLKYLDPAAAEILTSQCDETSRVLYGLYRAHHPKNPQ